MSYTIKKKNNTGPKGIGEADEWYAAPVNGQKSTIIDVVQTHKFTASPMTKYLNNKTPYVILFEYDMDFSSFVSQLIYYYKLTANGVNKIAGTSGGQAIKTTVEEWLKKIPTDAISDKIKTATQFVKNNTSISFKNPTTGGEFLNGAMTPYNKLYLRKSTGFTYILPYFDNLKRNIQNSFSQEDASLTSKSNIVQSLGGSTSNVAGLIENILGAALVTTPGAFMERPKFYNYGMGEETYKVHFDLINTLAPGDYAKHFDLLNLLIFQNLPYRLSLATIRPPKIYRCIIPGEQDLPYCYISALNVSFIGNRRILPVTSKVDQLTITDAIIPDVYRVELTIVSLTPPTGNFIINLNNKVNVKTATAAASPSDTPKANTTTATQPAIQATNASDVATSVRQSIDPPLPEGGPGSTTLDLLPTG